MANNHAIWLYNTSLDYLDGKNVPQDLSKSFTLNTKAAALGYHDAILAMGWYYLGGVGVAQNIEKAEKWYRKSARHDEPRAMFSLGRIGYDEQDFSESLTWFKRAAKKGHARSLYWIGKHYWYGHSVPHDRKEALRYFHLAANKKVIAATRVLKFLARRKR